MLQILGPNFREIYPFSQVFRTACRKAPDPPRGQTACRKAPVCAIYREGLPFGALALKLPRLAVRRPADCLIESRLAERRPTFRYVSTGLPKGALLVNRR